METKIYAYLSALVARENSINGIETRLNQSVQSVLVFTDDGVEEYPHPHLIEVYLMDVSLSYIEWYSEVW